MASTTTSQRITGHPVKTPTRKRMQSAYPLWFYLPAGILFLVLFVLPTFTSFYFSLTRWTLFDVHFIGLDNFVTFFTEDTLYSSFIHTLIYAFITCFAKIVFGIGLAVLLTSALIGRGYLRAVIFFPCSCRRSGSASRSRSCSIPSTVRSTRRWRESESTGPAG
jgi:raffinose/stachyose/melibiose transport system permease protein